MPPKFKFTREEIVDACFDIAKTDGLKAVTARGVAAKLNSSSKVLFSTFKDMSDVKNAVIERAKAYYKTYVDAGLSDPVPFKGVGEGYIRFAKEEPKLFNMLFMQESKSPSNIISAMHLDENYDRILKCAEDYYGLTNEQAVELYRCMWTTTHGLAVMEATKICKFSEGEAEKIMHLTIMGLLDQIKKQ